MKLYATITSERASKGQGGNEYIIIDLTVGNATRPQRVGQIELIYIDDKNATTDEWVLQYRDEPEAEWDIIAQGNVSKGKK